MKRIFWMAAVVVMATFPAARAGVVVIPIPSDDRWHYPFNFSGGSRAQASVFGSFGNPDFDGFNDRDAMFYIAWNTTTQVEPELPFEDYDVCAVTVVVSNQAGATWLPDITVDEWFSLDVNGDGLINADGQPRGTPGDNDGESYDADIGRPIEMFGLAFGTSIWSYENWNEFRPYQGAVCDPIPQGGACRNNPRSPFPFVYQDETGVELHVEDSAKGAQNEDLDVPLCSDPNGVCPFTPTPWAIGVPKFYLPRNQSIPFDVQFDIDLTLSDGRVRQYFQEQLSGGRVAVAITTLQLVPQEIVDPGFPSFFTKESTETPPQLMIWLAPDLPGDSDEDGMLTLDDFGGIVSCLRGPDVPPGTGAAAKKICRCDFDLDADGDVDLRDVARFEVDFGL